MNNSGLRSFACIFCESTEVVEIEEAIEEYRDMIMKDTLAEQIDERNDLTEEFNINGIEVKLDVARR